MVKNNAVLSLTLLPRVPNPNLIMDIPEGQGWRCQDESCCQEGEWRDGKLMAACAPEPSAEMPTGERPSRGLAWAGRAGMAASRFQCSLGWCGISLMQGTLKKCLSEARFIMSVTFLSQRSGEKGQFMTFHKPELVGRETKFAQLLRRKLD